MNKISKISTIVVVIVVAAIVAALILRRNHPAEIVLETTHVQKGDVRNIITATGTIEPMDQLDVGTQVSGVLKRIYVDYNATVKKGQLLAELDKTMLQSTVDQNTASLQSARTELEYLEKSYTRIQTLLEKDMVSRDAFDKAKYEYEKAKAAVLRAQAELDRSQINLSYASIYSPIDGVVLSRAVDEGQTVAASLNAPVLFVIAKDLTRMQVKVAVDEADIGQVRVQQNASFTVDAFTGETFNGTVTQVRLEPTVSSNVVTYSVIVEAPNLQRKLMPGMTATISIATKEAANTPTIPAKALRFKPEPVIMQAYMKQQGITFSGPSHSRAGSPNAPGFGKGMHGQFPPEFGSASDGTAMIWIKDGKRIHPVRITIGVNNGTTVQVLDGLQGEEEIVISMSQPGSNKKINAPKQQASSPFMPRRPGAAQRR